MAAKIQNGRQNNINHNFNASKLLISTFFQLCCHPVCVPHPLGFKDTHYLPLNPKWPPKSKMAAKFTLTRFILLLDVFLICFSVVLSSWTRVL
jgi:hypothetical protein